jgi:hypothetical protein
MELGYARRLLLDFGMSKILLSPSNRSPNIRLFFILISIKSVSKNISIILIILSSKSKIHYHLSAQYSEFLTKNKAEKSHTWGRSKGINK